MLRLNLLGNFVTRKTSQKFVSFVYTARAKLTIKDQVKS